MKYKLNKKTTLLAAIALTGVAGGLTSCGDSSIDKNKTQLYVKCYQGGYGNKWLYSAKERYEKLHENDSFESGKTGVQIVIADQKKTPSTAEIKNNQSELYFFEGLNYLNCISDDAFEDITDFVTGTNPYEKDKTIESKIYDGVANFMNIMDEKGQSHYYAVPHYVSNFGIVYNKTVFNKYNFY